MNDEPAPELLLRSVERFLEESVVPALTGVARFHARVAANVVAMVAREIETEDVHLRQEWDGLCELLGDEVPRPEARADLRDALLRRNQALVDRIRAGDVDTGTLRAAVLTHLRHTVDAKMQVSKPPRHRAPRQSVPR